MRVHGAVLICVLLVLTACGSDEVAPTTTAPSTTSTTQLATAGPAETFEVGASVTHPNGTQLRLERIQYFEGATVVELGISNGSRFGLALTRGSTDLVGGDGTVAPLLQDFEVDDFGPGEDRNLSLTFGPLQDREVVTLLFNQGNGTSPRNPSTNAPSFALGPVDLDASATRPALPDPAFLDRRTVADGGAELSAEGLVFTQTRIGMSVTIENRSPVEISISPAAAPSYVFDDLGNVYFLVMPEDSGFIAIPAGEARTGVLSFAGRIDPEATTLNLGINDDRSDQVFAEYPRFRIEGIPISGDTAATSTSPPEPIDIGEEQTHASGVTVRLDSMRFDDGGVQVAVSIVNPTGDDVALAAAPTAVVDDRGREMPLQPPSGNPGLAIEASSEITATLGFTGLPVPDAGEVTVAFNRGESVDDPETSTPAFLFGPYPISRTTTSQPVGQPVVFPVGLTSELVTTELTVAQSEIVNVASILRQFNATPVEGGFQLTLPDDILFDFGSAELRPDAFQSLSLIGDVLDYFSGDPVVVIGHTDSVGSDERNLELSVDRATSVKDALVDTHGIDPERIMAEGRGETEPVAANENPDGSDNPDGRQLNRRVEIVVLTDKPLPEG